MFRSMCVILVCLATLAGCATLGTRTALEESQKQLTIARETTESLRLDLVGVTTRLRLAIDSTGALKAAIANEAAKSESDADQISTLQDKLTTQVDTTTALTTDLAVLKAKVVASTQIVSEKVTKSTELGEQASLEAKQERREWFALVGNTLLMGLGLAGVGGLGRKGVS